METGWRWCRDSGWMGVNWSDELNEMPIAVAIPGNRIAAAIHHSKKAEKARSLRTNLKLIYYKILILIS